MSDSLNILILSCGTRNKIVQYFRKELQGRGLVMVTDCSELAPALYDADKYFIVPRMNEDGYLNNIIHICKENNIKAVLSLIDPELSLIAKHRQKFLDIGTTPVISDGNIIEMCYNKYLLHEFLVSNGLPTIRSYIDRECFYQDLEGGAIGFPVFVKPIQGSASIQINRVTSREELESLFSKNQNLLIQECMVGTEYGVDAYIDMISGETVSIFIKEKIKMRAGETDKSISVKDEGLFTLIQQFVKLAGFRGIIDIDVFKTNGEYFILEVNPRFGGGYPHAYECGVNVPEMIINNIKGDVNPNTIGQYDEGICMMKYNEVKIIRNRKF